jgi:hypothetical protein
MATLVLSTAGAAIGGLFGGFGLIAGRAIGALAGYALDQALFGNRRTVEGARLADLSVQSSREGAVIPRVYGRARIAGQIVWATEFEEVVSTERQGSKGGGGGTTVRSFSYFANLAIGLCEGPIARIGRVWADGKPFDLSGAVHRVYTGTEDQNPDSLIEAKQGPGAAPAYRGLAYVVFERLPLEEFGNRIPQFAFEVIRPVPGVAEKVKAVALIPGATEFGYDPEPVYAVVSPGNRVALNRHLDGTRSDWHASLDDLQTTCPAVGHVSLVVSWFGDDLRAGYCTLRPKVDNKTRVTAPTTWSVAGLTRATAEPVSLHEGRAAYGGTPSDASVIRAIQDLKARGLKVAFYPFVMMDIPHGNALPDPYGGAAQASYPWRGRITASIAPGLPESPDRTEAAGDEIAAFVGAAAPTDFSLTAGGVGYVGPDEWTFRRMILHAAFLCKAAGGVDAFLLGSELRGLTTLRSGPSGFPFVTALVNLAADVRGILGHGTRISYGADWSEYFGYQPADGSGDVFFHLDPLWADANIDFVGIDNYLPLSDWRDGDDHLDAAEWETGRDTAYLRANIAGGEYFDWFYASDADRAAQIRTPIGDDAYGKPWVFRPKDLVSWWSNPHFDRPGGIEAETPTAWQPRSKPIVLTETGCPAVDKGPNQPNVFPDPKSGEGTLPRFSTGVRDDVVQRRFIGAVTGYWDPEAPDFDDAANPVSDVYAGRMIDPGTICWWAWDARPYPAFPYRLDVWSDGGNWEAGHWLNGRLAAPTTDALAAAILRDHDFPHAAIEDLDGAIDGYVVATVASARDALEPLADLLLFEAADTGDTIRLVRRGRRPVATLGRDDLVDEGERPLLSIRRAQETELPSEIAIGFVDALADYRAANVSSRRLTTGSRRSEGVETTAVMSFAVAGGLADTRLRDIWAGRESFGFALSARRLAIEPGDIVRLDLPSGQRTAMVRRIEDMGPRRIEARSIEPGILAAVPATPRTLPPVSAPEIPPPEVVVLDLPVLSGDGSMAHAPRIAAFADPWPGAIGVALGTPATGFVPRQVLDRSAVLGELATSLAAGPQWRWDRASTVDVLLYGGALASEPELAVLNGANAAAVGSPESGWEIVQFQTATLIGPRTWRIGTLLRAQAATGDAAPGGHPTGARFVLLNAATPHLAIGPEEAELALVARCGPAGATYDPGRFVDVPVLGTRRGLKCFPPVRPHAVWESSGDISIRWIRQTRLGGDGWEGIEVPLGETSEAYRVDLLIGDIVVHTETVGEPRVTLSAALLADLFGGTPDSLHARIMQVSPTEGPGLATETTFHA